MTPHLRSDVLTAPHGFFTRAGGVSAGPYASLNCSLSSADEREAVLENRSRAAQAVGARLPQLVGLMQVHGRDAIRVSEAWRPGEGPSGDAMVTDRPGMALGIVTADCAPVLFADEEAGIIGAAHAGWRGAVAGVLEATLEAMMALGASIGRVRAAVGPCIGQASYEVGAEVRDAVLHAASDGSAFITDGRRPGHWQFDLGGYCVWRLRRAGVNETGRIDADTAAEQDRFFSHRRRVLAGGGPIGHQISIIALPA